MTAFWTAASRAADRRRAAPVPSIETRRAAACAANQIVTGFDQAAVAFAASCCVQTPTRERIYAAFDEALAGTTFDGGLLVAIEETWPGWRGVAPPGTNAVEVLDALWEVTALQARVGRWAEAGRAAREARLLRFQERAGRRRPWAAIAASAIAQERPQG